jgi:hypothetical protein
MGLVISVVCSMIAVTESRAMAMAHSSPNIRQNDYETYYIPTNKCICNCASIATDPGCTACAVQKVVTNKRTPDINTTTCSTTCYQQFKAELNENIVNGAAYTRANGCSPWTIVLFNNAKTFYLLGTGLYVKNYDTSLFEIPVARAAPPIVQFPGLSIVSSVRPITSTALEFNNYTCYARCCKQMVVTRSLISSACTKDLKKCTSAISSNHESLPSCSDSANVDKCIIWAPCDKNDRLGFWLVLTLCVIAYIALSVIRWYFFPFDMFSAVYVWLLSAVFLTTALASFAAYSNFQHWVDSTEVSKEYASYQSCVAYCNSNMKPSSKDIAGNLCADGENDKNPYAYWDVNFNPYVPSGCVSGLTPSNSYCEGCARDTGRWKDTMSAAHFLLANAIIVILECFLCCSMDTLYAYLNDTKSYSSTSTLYVVFPYLIMFLAALNVALFISSIVFFIPLYNNSGQNFLVSGILEFQGSGTSVHDMTATAIAFNVLSVVACISAIMLFPQPRDNAKQTGYASVTSQSL